MSKICLIDGSGFIFRAFHALPPLNTKDGTPVNAVYGFAKSIMALQENRDIEYIAVIFDASRYTFRQDLYKEYKAQRPPAPEDLIPQFPLIRQMTDALNIASVEMEGFEADDLIATYARMASELGIEVEIISSDKDLMQLVDDSKNIHMYDAFKRKIINEAGVMEKFAVTPDKVIDLQALIGDSADNVPGVKGIGPKGGADLINTFGDIDGIYANIDSITKKALKENLIRDKELAYISKQLVTLKQDVPVKISLEDLKTREPDPKKLCSFLQELSFDSLAVKISSKYKIDLSEFISNSPLSIHKPVENILKKTSLSFDKQIDNIADLQEAVQKLSNNYLITMLHHYNKGNKLLCIYDTKNDTNYYIDLQKEELQKNLFEEEIVSKNTTLSEKEVFVSLKNILENEAILKIGYNLKNLMHIASIHDVSIKSYDDIEQMAYVVDGVNNETQKIVSLLKENLFIEKYSEDIEVSPNFLTDLYYVYRNKIIENKLNYLYEVFDKPLLRVLFNMEKTGVKVDASILKNLSAEFEIEIKNMEKQIFELSTEEFNIGSPKQLGEILFEKMGIKGKKNKTGSWKTDVSVLEVLQEEGIIIAGLILKWRQLSKLKNTYTDKLPEKIDPINGRIHTTYLACATTTARLSSIVPNLQNIPIKSEQGKNIRKAFLSKAGYKIISLDYSQIELRILASIGNVSSLVKAFENGEDIHKSTASEMFNVPLNDVNSSLRRQAKAINFGIIYGQTAYGLSSSLGISREVAKEYIESYFLKYPEIKQYMDDTVLFAKKHGFVKTEFNRKCFMDGINSSNGNMRNFAERVAINARIQGTGADIMRKALIDVNKFLVKSNIDASILLQIHDEMVIEAKEDIAEDLAQKVQKIMENCCNIGTLLNVDYGISDNWFEK